MSTTKPTDQEASSGSDLEVVSCNVTKKAVKTVSKYEEPVSPLTPLAHLKIPAVPHSLVLCTQPRTDPHLKLSPVEFNGVRNGKVGSMTADFLGTAVVQKWIKSGLACAWVPQHVSEKWVKSQSSAVEQQKLFNKEHHKILLVPAFDKGHFSLFIVCHAGAILISEA